MSEQFPIQGATPELTIPVQLFVETTLATLNRYKDFVQTEDDGSTSLRLWRIDQPGSKGLSDIVEVIKITAALKGSVAPEEAVKISSVTEFHDGTIETATYMVEDGFVIVSEVDWEHEESENEPEGEPVTSTKRTFWRDNIAELTEKLAAAKPYDQDRSITKKTSVARILERLGVYN